MISIREIAQEDTAEAFNELMDTLAEIAVPRTAAICALLSVAAVQIAGRMLSQDEMIMAVNGANEYLALLLVEPVGPVQ